MLNDISRQTRTLLFLQMLGPGLMFGSVFGIDGGHWAATAVLAGIGLTVTIGWAVAVVVWNRRADRAVKVMLVGAGEDLVARRVTGVPAVGRVHRRRIARSERRGRLPPARRVRRPGPGGRARLRPTGA